jgi:hypothetical protein
VCHNPAVTAVTDPARAPARARRVERTRDKQTKVCEEHMQQRTAAIAFMSVSALSGEPVRRQRWRIGLVRHPRQHATQRQGTPEPYAFQSACTPFILCTVR